MLTPMKLHHPKYPKSHYNMKNSCFSRFLLIIIQRVSMTQECLQDNLEIVLWLGPNLEAPPLEGYLPYPPEPKYNPDAIRAG